MNKKRQGYDGGVFLTVLLLLFVCSMIFSFVLINYQQDLKIKVQAKEFYQSRIIEVLTVSEINKKIEQGEKITEGKETYNIGGISYKIKQDEIETVTVLETGKEYRNHYSIQKKQIEEKDYHEFE